MTLHKWVCWFSCNECGYELDGDYNAAKNVGLKLLTVPEGKRPSGLGNGQLALKSRTVNMSDGGSSAEFRPEGESHGQAHRLIHEQAIQIFITGQLIGRDRLGAATS